MIRNIISIIIGIWIGLFFSQKCLNEPYLISI